MMRWDHMMAQFCFFFCKKKKMTLPPTKPFSCQHLSDERYPATVGNLAL